MDPESRAKTNPSLAKQDGLPVVVNDVERVWTARTSSGYTAMGVRFRKGTECTGVLLEVTTVELADLDTREANYVRVQVHLDNVEQVSFLSDEEYYETEQSDALFEAKEEQSNEISVWVYVQKEPIPADSSHPIPQSYVDIILKGCLTISEDFARSFIDTTKGWHNQDGEGPSFVDDRENPIYIRADKEASAEHAEVIDQLLEEHRPTAFENRVEYDAEDHLEALEEALEDDLAHPRAIKKAEARVEEVVAERAEEERLENCEKD